MCGRIFQTLPLSRLLQIARTSKATNEELHSASYNVCPTTYIPVIRNSPLYENNEEPEQNDEAEINKQRNEEEEQPEEYKERELSFMKWGSQTKFNMILNGRIEELTSKRTFVNIIKNRCVVIMEGYYEWQKKSQKQKQPFCFRNKKQDHFLVAGLYTPNNEIIILTKDAIPSIAHVHERMPVILSEKEVQLWLDPKNTQNINTIINKCLLDKEKAIWKNIGFAQVAPYVNKTNEKSVKCLMSLEEYNNEKRKNGITKFFKKKTVETVGKDGQILEERQGNQEKRQSPERKNPISSHQKEKIEEKQEKQEKQEKEGKREQEMKEE